MKKLEVVAIVGWILGAGLIITEAFIGPGPLILGVFILWAPAAVWGFLRYSRGAARVVNDEWYVPIENATTLADQMANLNGAFANLGRAMAGRKPPTI